MSDTPTVRQITILEPHPERGPTPYGYWHILKVYEDGSWWPIGTVKGSYDKDAVVAIATILARPFGCKVVIGKREEKDWEK